MTGKKLTKKISLKQKPKLDLSKEERSVFAQALAKALVSSIKEHKNVSI